MLLLSHTLPSVAKYCFPAFRMAYYFWLADRRVDIRRYESLPANSGFTLKLLKLLSMQFFRGAPTGQRWQLFQDGTMNHARVDASLTSWTGNLQKHSSCVLPNKSLPLLRPFIPCQVASQGSSNSSSKKVPEARFSKIGASQSSIKAL